MTAIHKKAPSGASEPPTPGVGVGGLLPARTQSQALYGYGFRWAYGQLPSGVVMPGHCSGKVTFRIHQGDGPCPPGQSSD